MKFKRPKYLELVKDKELHSSAWLDTELIDDPTGGDDIYKLVAAKRAIKNFVHILTGDPTVKVVFEGTDSYTDGKTVTIANVIKKTTDFDVTVGLALHEASHILLTDFGTLDTISNMVVTDNPTEIGLPSNLTNKIDLNGYKVLVKTLVNIIEDRRIDAYVYTNAPGYRGYYDSLYHKYFWHKTIDKALLSAEYTDETIESYLFRLTNITNPNTNLDALKNLRKISDMIGLDFISRFENTGEVLTLADEIAKIIVAGLPDGSSKNNPNNSESGNGENSTGNGENSNSESNSGGSESGNGENSETDGSESGNGENSDSDSKSGNGENSDSESGGSDSDNGNFTPTTELTESQKKALEKLVQKQKDFLDGNIKKSKVTKKDGKRIQTVEEAGASTKKVGNGYTSDNHWETRKNPTDLVILEKMTKKIIESNDDIFPLSDNYYDGLRIRCSEAVSKGIRLGQILAKKLMTRAEERSTIYNRQKTGKIDGRMLATLGFGNENVFSIREIDKYKKANLHISVDASGSMGGEKWNKTMTNVVALAVACSKIPNLEVQISFRSTVYSGSGDLPWVVLAYDSRKDKIQKIKSLFPYLRPAGTTPEGLCFEGIQDRLIPTSNDMDSYFLNISDGAPYFANKEIYYSGDGANKHTRREVKKMEAKGIKILSYFVSREGESSYKDDFIQMYGKTAKFINVESVSEISKTMNKLFMEK